MFFHRIERLSDGDRMKENISGALNDRHYTVIPLVKPGSAVGKYLMDPEQSAIISDYSGTHINIFYTGENLKSEFDQFMIHIFSEIGNISGAKINAPGLLIFFPQKEHLVNIEVAVEDDPKKFRVVMFQLIDALESSDPLKNVKRLKYEINAILIENDHSHTIDGLYNHVIKFFV
jgi:hypothetical protein